MCSLVVYQRQQKHSRVELRTIWDWELQQACVCESRYFQDDGVLVFELDWQPL